MKRILLCILASLCCFSVISTMVSAVSEDDFTYLYSYKSGRQENVFHYGTKEKVMLPKSYFGIEQEMRGVWVATVYNIAIGKQKGTQASDIEAWKSEFLAILDTMESYGMNTLFFQIRPSNDAFYRSKLNTWSEFLVGAGIDPGWDPLEWMIEQTHARGFAFHGWMNAFRVTTYKLTGEQLASRFTNSQLLDLKKDALSNLPDGNFAKEHPEYVVMGEYDTRLILNPSEPAVQQFITDTISEIIENYDVDGLHFDDYFYLNGQTSSDTANTNFAGGRTYNEELIGKDILNDLGNYRAYQNKESSYIGMAEGYTLGDFRRESLNRMMRNIRSVVDQYNQQTNKYVEFGSKPAAVWRSNVEYCYENAERCTEEGSNTHPNAYTSYNDLFADTLQWVKEGLVDYMSPQVYYAFEDNYAPFADVVDWWAEQIDKVNVTRRANGEKEIKLYIAHGIYKYRDNPDQFYNAGEIRNQITYLRKHDCIKGSAVYSYENLVKFTSTNHESGMKYLKNNWVNNPTYPLSIGEYNAKGLKIDDYQIRIENTTKKTNIYIPLVENVNVYGIYKIPKGEAFSNANLKNRIIVKYAPYQDGKNVIIDLDTYDDNFDYYVQVLSDRNHISDEVTKLDFNQISYYDALNIDRISSVKEKVVYEEIIDLTINYSYLGNQKLNYELYYLETDRNYSILASYGEVVDSVLKISWEAYNFKVDHVVLKIVLTDGVHTAELSTNEFSIAKSYTEQPEIITCPKCGEQYEKGTTHICQEDSKSNCSSCKKNDLFPIILALITLGVYLIVKKHK